MIRTRPDGNFETRGTVMDRKKTMKLAAIILSKFSSKKPAEADPFELRLSKLNKDAQRRARTAARPTLFVRHANA